MISITDSIASHARELSKTLREADRLEAVRMGLNPDKMLFTIFRRALYRKTGLVHGEVAAMWGVIGAPMSSIGTVYLVTGTKIKDVSPIKFARIYKQEVKVMSNLFSLLENHVDASYTGAVRMLELAGFKLTHPDELNFRKFSMINGDV